jgi:hypothetical protein
MKGETDGLLGRFSIQHNASQPYASCDNGTEMGSEREFVSDLDCVCLKTVHCRKGTADGSAHDAGETIHGLWPIDAPLSKRDGSGV